MHYLILLVYWLIFWNKHLRNPYLLATSEIATTNFPHWIWMGKRWRSQDSIYYRYPASIPFLSMWYFPHILLSRLSKHMKLDDSFKVYAYGILIHYLLASIIAYHVLGLFGAITLTYSAFNVKPQTHSFVYTMTWMPGMLIDGWFGAFSLFMAITGGYFPILVYFIPIAAILNPLCLIGLIPSLIQIIPFMVYFKKSNRWGSNGSEEGKFPLARLIDFIKPSNNVTPSNGVHYPEVAVYCGIACFLIWKLSIWWIPLIISILIVIGCLPRIQRIPSRALYVTTFCIAMISNVELTVLLIIQMFLLFRNSSQYPSFPFSQWWNKPSKIYPSMDYTGYLTDSKKHDYCGGFSLRGSNG